MPVTLTVRTGNAEASAEAQSPSITFDSPRIVLGRGEGSDLRVPDRSVSHRHASVRQRGAEYIVLDEGSTNGTFLGSVRLQPHTPRVVRSGDLLRIGRVWIEIRIEHVPPTQQPAVATREVALSLIAEALRQQGDASSPRLVVVEGPDLGKHLDLTTPMRPFVVGRGRDADLMIDLNEASRRHAQVMRRGDVLLVRDLGSRIGTTRDGQQVPVDKDMVFKHGEQFAIGPDIFAFEHPAVEALQELEHASDEPLDPRKPVDPPPRIPPPAAPKTPSTEATPEPHLADQTHTPPPQKAEERIERPPTRSAEPTGWGKTDVLVVLLALVVLGLSAVGLFWLFRAG